MKNRDIISTWKKCYEITQPTEEQKKKRLRELSTWDKPFGTPSEDKNGMWREWVCKKMALEILLEEGSN